MKVALFADDIALWTAPPPPTFNKTQARAYYQQAVGQLRTCLCMVNLWSAEWRMNFSASKTKYVHFTQCKIASPSYTLNRTPLPPQPYARYLGVWFDPKLTYKVHVEKLCKKVRSRIAMASSLVAGLVGLSPDRFSQIYITTIRPCMEFASAVWYPALKKNLRNKIHALHKLCLRIAAGAKHSTPPDALEVLLGIQPFHDRFEQAAARLVSRSIRLPNTHPQRTTLRTSLARLSAARSHDYSRCSAVQFGKRAHVKLGTWEHETTAPIESLDTRVMPIPSPSTWTDTDRPCWDELEARLDPRDTIVYTDGSAINNPGRAGSGVYIETPNDLYQFNCSLGNTVTISYAELKAIHDAAVWCINNTPHNKVFILSDSQYAVNAIKGHWKISKHKNLVVTIRNHLNTLKQQCEVFLYYVPAHSNIEGNEIADFQAKMAARDSPNQTIVPVSYDTAKALVRQAQEWCWNRKWGESSTQLASIVPKVSMKRRKWYRKKSRAYVRKVTRFFTGHMESLADYRPGYSRCLES